MVTLVFQKYERIIIKCIINMSSKTFLYYQLFTFFLLSLGDQIAFNVEVAQLRASQAGGSPGVNLLADSQNIPNGGERIIF